MVVELERHALERGLDHEWYVRRAAVWLRNHQGCPIVLTIRAACNEQPDAIGFGPFTRTVVVECKRSRGDFFRDAEKPFRKHPSRGLGTQRYYLTPLGMLRLEEVPDGWGLLEVQASKVTRSLEAPWHCERNRDGELALLLSHCRRERNRGGEVTGEVGFMDGLGV